MKRFSPTLTFLLFGYAFLYIPLLTLIAYSFNESSIVSVWTGFSFKWYAKLFTNDQILKAGWVSLKIAVVAATVSVVFGTIIALILVRFGRFRGRTLFLAMISAPLVMPDVIMGLSLLFLFVILGTTIGGVFKLGIGAVMVAHITLAMAYVAVLIQTRLSEVDLSLEEAALDLGAYPIKVFFVVTLPIIAPSLFSGWLLAFTLSLDDVVLASFLSAPESTTLPMVIFSSIRYGLNPQINALSTLMIVVVFVGIYIANMLRRRRKLK